MKKTKQEAGKMGADVRWKDRKEMIIEVSKNVSRIDLEHIMKWPTDHIKRLLDIWDKKPQNKD